MSKKSICKNCHWWRELPYGDAMYCEFIDTLHNNKEATGCDITYITLDDQGLEYWLKTGPEFGCVNFKEKEA